MAPRASIQELLGISLPIIQAPMAGVQGSALAISVSRAGGLGSLPCALLSTEAMHKELSTIKSQTDKPYNVNFFCHTQPELDNAREATWREALSPYYTEYGIDMNSIVEGPTRLPFNSEACAILEEFRPPVVSFHFGLPDGDLLERVKLTGAKIISTATTVEEAIWLEDRGVDAIIAQGFEAGGHRGMFLSEDVTTQVGTFALVRQIVDQVKVPVIAAGGISDSKGMRAALELGAAGVQIGTAYLLCPEVTTTSLHRVALSDAHACRHTALTNVFTGRPARAIMNRAVREIGPMTKQAPAFPLAFSAILPLRQKAEERGSNDFSPLWCGQNASGCKNISAYDLTLQLGSEIQ